MKRDFIESLGIEDKEVIDKIMAENGNDINKAKGELETIKTQLADKEKSIAELSEKIKNYDGADDKLKELQKKVNSYERAEKERKEAEAKAEADKVLTQTILEGIGDKQFVNDYTKDSIINQIKVELKKTENEGKGTKEILEALTKDKEGIFKNPQQAGIKIPPAGSGAGTNDADMAKMRAVMGLPPIK